MPELPPAARSRGLCLTRAASPDNLAMMARFIPLMARMEEPILDPNVA